jgi:hypothetical protein
MIEYLQTSDDNDPESPVPDSGSLVYLSSGHVYGLVCSMHLLVDIQELSLLVLVGSSSGS